MINKTLRRFNVSELILIAAMAAIGIAIKPVILPLVHLVSTPLMIPGGALAGGLYMMWIIVAAGLTGRLGAATLVGVVQAIIVVLTGVTGSHGIMSFVTYIAPGVMVDLFLLISRHRVCCMPCAFVSGIIANVTGTALTNMVFFSLPVIPLVLSLAVAAFSGAVGGLLSWTLLSALKKYNIGVRQS